MGRGRASLDLPERYRLIRRLGHGGHGDVLLCEDRGGAPSPKALKILLPDVDPAVLAGFRDEFRILASLDHPGLARVFEFGQLADGRAFYTAEFVDGRELDQGPDRSLRRVCVAMAAVCRALGYIHTRGYVHNDVKPSNILVGGSPDAARLLDFGLAGLDRAASRTVSGTPGYIAPERLAGRAWNGLADLYAVGAALYAVLGGRRVTDVADPGRALAALRATRPTLHELRPDVPAALADLTERLLSHDPDHRPQTPAEVIAGLGEALGEVLPLETPGTARSYALSSLIVGRERELGEIEQMLGAAASGAGPRLLLLQAGAGLGKTRLLREATFRAGLGGWRTARATCDEHDQGREPLSRLDAQIGGASPPEGTGKALEHLVAAAGQPGSRWLVVLDDAHRAADAVWRTLAQTALASSRRALPLVIALGVDPESLPPEARQWIALLEVEGAHRAISLAPLGEDALRKMVSALFGSGALTAETEAAVVRRAAGNPLVLEELARELVETGSLHSMPAGWQGGRPATGEAAPSDRLEDLLRRRCRDLPGDATAVLAALAALGGSAGPEDIAAVAGAATDATLGVSVLAGRSLVLRDGPRVELAHEALRRPALSSLDAAGHRHVHRAAAEWLEAADRPSGRIAHAWIEAGDPARAFPHALAAGQSALASGENRLAVVWLEKAAAAARAAGIRGEPLARALGELGNAYRHSGRMREGLEALTRAFFEREPGCDRETVRLAASAAGVAAFLDDPGTSAAWTERAQAAVPAGDRLAQALVDLRRGTTAWYLQDHEAARDKLSSVLAALDALPWGPLVGDTRVAVCMNLTAVLHRFDRAATRQLAERTLAEAERVGNASFVAQARVNLALGELHGGAPLGEVERRLRAAADEFEHIGAIGVLPILLMSLGLVERRMGLRAAGAAALDRARALARATPQHRAHVATAEAQDAFWFDDAEKALALVRIALEDWTSWQDFPLLLAIGAAAAAERGRIADADAIATRVEVEAGKGRSPLAAALASAARAYRRALDDPRAGADALRAAASEVGKTSQAADAAILLRDAGRWFGRAGALEEARACLSEARDLLLRAGATAAVEPVDRIEADLGRATRHAGRPDVDGLLAAIAAATDTRALARSIRAMSDGMAGHWDADAGRTLAGTLARILPRLGERPPASPASAGSIDATLVDTPGGLTRGSGRPLTRAESRVLELTLGGLHVRGPFGGIVGQSGAMTEVVGILERLAGSDVPVLLIGETGTGKEVLARALHAAGARAAAPFVVLDCASVPTTLFESELFGHRRGAFSGAVDDRRGVVEQADGGLLFLDNVGELVADLQPKLLRVLATHRLRPLGARLDVPVDFRLVAATSRDLGREVDAGRFRADLYYRLAVVEVRLPPLRDRLEDLPALCAHLLARGGHRGMRLTAGALQRLSNHRWPGNVRELENELSRAASLAGAGPIRERHLSARLLRVSTGSMPIAARGSLQDRMDAFEREVLRQALAGSGGNHTHAATALRLSRSAFNAKLKRFGVAPTGRPGRPSRRMT